MPQTPSHGVMLEIAGLAAQIILENGAETYRVEDTVQRLCKSYGFGEVNVMALTTGVFISISAEGESHSAVRRVGKRGINLARVNRVNDLSRRAAEGTVPMETMLALLRDVRASHALPPLRTVIVSGVAAACFTLMFGGGVVECLTTLVCAILGQLAAHYLSRAEMSLVLISLAGAAISAAVAGCAFYIFRWTPAELETTISGAIMPLLSGLMMTSAVRDSLRGDLLSGLARAVEALLVAVMVALGISVPLKVLLPGEMEMLLATPPAWYLAVMYAGLATLFFAPLLRLPTRAYLPVALLGAASYAGYLLLVDVIGWSTTLALFAASAVVALLCEFLARRMRMIVTVFLTGALIPLVPGLALYRTMRALLYSQYQDALTQGLATLFAIGAIALGAAVGPGLRQRGVNRVGDRT